MPKTSVPATHQFMTVEGFECVQHLFPCGCFHETYYTTQGDIELIRLQVCTDCFDEAGRELEQLSLDKRAQLTLHLPSAEGDRGC